jgi:hypothetical protein
MPTQPNEEKHYLTLETKNEKFTSIINARCWGALFAHRHDNINTTMKIIWVNYKDWKPQLCDATILMFLFTKEKKMLYLIENIW